MFDLWNGEVLDEFFAQCGVREGVLISPYLPVLCIERLFHLIQVVMDKKTLEAYPKYQKGTKAFTLGGRMQREKKAEGVLEDVSNEERKNNKRERERLAKQK